MVGFIWESIAAEVPVVDRRVWDYERLFAKAPDSASPNRWRERGHSTECRIRRMGRSSHCICREIERFPSTREIHGRNPPGVNLILLVGGEEDAGPLAKTGRADANVDSNIQGFAFNDAAELGLGVQ
jgi:hypothetical protein